MNQKAISSKLKFLLFQAVNEVYLVQSNETKEAFEKIEARFEDSVVNWEIVSVSKTKICDFFPYVEEVVIENN